VAPSHGVHDHSSHLVYLFSGWLHHLSCARWREIFRIHRLARGGLLSDPGFARSVGVCDAAVGHFDACSRFSSPMGPAQADRTLDDPDLALRVRHWSSGLSNALQVVSATGRDAGNPACKVGAERIACATTQILRSTAI